MGQKVFITRDLLDDYHATTTDDGSKTPQKMSNYYLERHFKQLKRKLRKKGVEFDEYDVKKQLENYWPDRYYWQMIDNYIYFEHLLKQKEELLSILYEMPTNGLFQDCTFAQCSNIFDTFWKLVEIKHVNNNHSQNNTNNNHSNTHESEAKVSTESLNNNDVTNEEVNFMIQRYNDVFISKKNKIDANLSVIMNDSEFVLDSRHTGSEAHKYLVAQMAYVTAQILLNQNNIDVLVWGTDGLQTNSGIIEKIIEFIKKHFKQQFEALAHGFDEYMRDLYDILLV